MTRGWRRQVFGFDLCFRRGLEHAPETNVVARGHLEGVARVPLPACRCARASFHLGQIDEVQAETSARMCRDGTCGPTLCLCPAPEVEDRHPVRDLPRLTNEGRPVSDRS